MRGVETKIFFNQKSFERKRLLFEPMLEKTKPVVLDENEFELQKN